MKKLFTYTLITSSLLVGSCSAKADWDFWATKQGTVSTCVSSSGECTVRSTKSFSEGAYALYQYNYVDEENNVVIYDSGGGINSYNLKNNAWTTLDGTQWQSNYQSIFARQNVKKKSDGSIHIGEKIL